MPTAMIIFYLAGAIFLLGAVLQFSLGNNGAAVVNIVAGIANLLAGMVQK